MMKFGVLLALAFIGVTQAVFTVSVHYDRVNKVLDFELDKMARQRSSAVKIGANWKQAADDFLSRIQRAVQGPLKETTNFAEANINEWEDCSKLAQYFETKVDVFVNESTVKCVNETFEKSYSYVRNVLYEWDKLIKIFTDFKARTDFCVTKEVRSEAHSCLGAVETKARIKSLTDKIYDTVKLTSKLKGHTPNLRPRYSNCGTPVKINNQVKEDAKVVKLNIVDCISSHLVEQDPVTINYQY